MSTEQGDMVIYQPSPNRATVDIVDSTPASRFHSAPNTDYSDPNQDYPYHLATSDTFASEYEFLNVSAMDRQLESLTAAVLELANNQPPVTHQQKPTKPQQAKRASA